MGTRAQGTHTRPEPAEGTDGPRLDDAPSLPPERAQAVLPHVGHIVRDLETLLRIAATLPTIRSTEELARQLLRLTFEAIAADGGAVFIAASLAEGVEAGFAWRRDEHPLPSPVLPTAILRRLLEERVPVMQENPGADGLWRGGMVAAPLIVLDRVVGALCLWSEDPVARLGLEHLGLLAGIAGIAAGALDGAMTVERLLAENRRLREEVEIEHGIVGASVAIRAVFEFIGKAAPTQATVLIRGESGTGKELVARAIHRNSPRAARPFAAINCAALTESLLESELFGHEKGAFTGAIALKKGRLEEAAGGSVFLDEVGEMAAGLQAKLLRVLQEREFERVGGARTIKTDIRLIAATNRDLEEAVRAGTFRRDLYYRLNVVSTMLPPLRERREDIVPLAEHFLRKHSLHARRHIRGFSTDARQWLTGHNWPGNVRELENAVERAVVLGSNESILPADLSGGDIHGASAADLPPAGFHAAVLAAKKQIVLRAVEEAGGSYVQAARVLGLHPNNLHRLIRALRLRP